MAWNPAAVLEVRDDTNQITVTVEKDSRTQQRVVTVAVLCILVLALILEWRSGQRGMQFYAGLLLIVCIYSLLSGARIEKSELHVRAANLSYSYRSASGNRNGQFAASEIREIEYGQGGKYSPSGLYVRHGVLGHTCILPNVTEDEAYRLRGVIMDRFPEFNNGLAAPNSIITLGLNR